MKKEIIIYKTRFPIGFFHVVPLLLVIGALRAWYDGNITRLLLLIAIALAWYLLARPLFRTNRPMIKITDKFLWRDKRSNIYWDSIQFIRFRDTGGMERHTVMMDIYTDNDVFPHEEFDLAGIHISAWRLRRILKRYTKVE